MIVLDEKIVAIWFIGMDQEDYLAAIRELVPDEKYELKYRFRYHKDDKAFDSKDKKHWYSGTVSGTRNYVILSLRTVTRQLSELSNGELYELINDKGFDAFLREFQKAPFNYMRMATPEDEAYFMKEQKNG